MVNGERQWVSYEVLEPISDDFEAIGMAFEEERGIEPCYAGKAGNEAHKSACARRLCGGLYDSHTVGSEINLPPEEPPFGPWTVKPLGTFIQLLMEQMFRHLSATLHCRRLTGEARAESLR